ncbi:MAG: DUF166 family protein [Promethearchaeati archaeon SRVP18_Atabeyarchaeia-1]
MEIGILSDGKYGDRAYENIKRRFPTEWILVESPDSPIVDDAKLDIPKCDLYISYLRHPDIVLALLEKRVPTILGVSFGLGFLNQAKRVFEKVLAPMTMCSLESGTGVREFDEYAKFYGRPKFDARIDDGRISHIDILRESPCGSTRGAAGDVIGVPLSVEMLQFFALRVCHYCRAPRFGRTCDKEFSGVLHLHELLSSIVGSSSTARSMIGGYASEIEKMYLEKLDAKPI